jgi:hypothetical protein
MGKKKTQAHILKHVVPVTEYPAREALHQEPGIQPLLLPRLGEIAIPAADGRDKVFETKGHRLEFTVRQYKGVGGLNDLAMPIENQFQEAEDELEQRGLIVDYYRGISPRTYSFEPVGAEHGYYGLRAFQLVQDSLQARLNAVRLLVHYLEPQDVQRFHVGDRPTTISRSAVGVQGINDKPQLGEPTRLYV